MLDNQQKLLRLRLGSDDNPVLCQKMSLSSYSKWTGTEKTRSHVVEKMFR